MSVNRDKLVNVLMEMPEVEPSRNLHAQIIHKIKKVDSVASLGVTVVKFISRKKGPNAGKSPSPGMPSLRGIRYPPILTAERVSILKTGLKSG